MNGVLLDTSAYPSAPENTEITQAIESASAIYMNAVTLGELLSGFRGGAHFQRNINDLEEFIHRTDTKILSIDDGTAERYAIIRHFLKEAGTPVSPNDLWIAATAMQYGLKLLTTDRDFEKIPQVLIQLF